MLTIRSGRNLCVHMSFRKHGRLYGKSIDTLNSKVIVFNNRLKIIDNMFTNPATAS